MVSNHIRPQFKYSQQTALYESIKMHTSYHNNIKSNIVNKLKSAVNILLGARNRRCGVHAAGVAAGLSAEATKESIYNYVTAPFGCFKITISQRITDQNFGKVRRRLNDDNLQIALDALPSIPTSYTDDFHFDKNNIYYDSKFQPLNHFKAYHNLGLP
ncbi:hypothetical protein BD560DRAFT_336697 [Blakeslea trispora]|nr:hypothetical protein BD560DRAFT_336697 [Blakeslea trispora]